MAFPTRFTQARIPDIRIANLTDRGVTLTTNHPNFT
jgi:hypothetical protein